MVADEAVKVRRKQTVDLKRGDRKMISKRSLLGTMLIAVGFIILSIGIVYPLVTVYIDSTPPEIDSFMMAAQGSFFEISKDRNNPTMLSKGYAYYFFGYVKENGNLSSGLCINILSADSNWVLGSNVFSAGIPETKCVSYFDTYLHQFYSETVTWTPMSEGNYVICLYVTDAAGNVGSQDRFVTVKTAVQEVSGYFTINGIKIEPPGDINITLTTRNLTFEFVCTAGADNVYETGDNRPMITGFPNTIVYLNREPGTNIWSGSYTVPQDGTYTINGIVKTEQGQTICFMTILMTTGNPRLSFSMQRIEFIVIGLALIVIGAVGTRGKI
jgi:hypothetical protein